MSLIKEIGQKGKDNGLLFVMSLQDRKYRFEVGYGLESVLPDGRVGSLGRQILVPFFKQGQYGQGIVAVVGRILEILSVHYDVTLAGIDQLPAIKTPQQDDRLASLIFLLFVLAGVVLVYSRSVNRKMRGSSRHGSVGRGTAGPIIFAGGGWGRGSSGGFGGFSGGGGGFGGGGASGGW